MPFHGGPDDVLIRQPDGLITPADPRVAVVRFPKDVESIDACIGLAYPCLRHDVEGGAVQRPPAPGADYLDLKVSQCRPNPVEPARRNSDLEVLVFSGLPAAEQVKGPAGRDAPRHIHITEPLGDLDRAPGFPGRVRRLLKSARWKLIDHAWFLHQVRLPSRPYGSDLMHGVVP